MNLCWFFLCGFLICSRWTFWHRRITLASCWLLMVSFRLHSWSARLTRHQVVRVQGFVWVCGPVLYDWASWSSSSPCLPRWYLAKSFLVTSPTTCSRPDTKKCDVRATVIIALITVHWKTLSDNGINPKIGCPCEGWNTQESNTQGLTEQHKHTTLFSSSTTTTCLSPSALNSLNTRGRDVSYKQTASVNFCFILSS